MTEFKTIGDRAQLSLPADSPVGSPTELPYTPYMYAEVPNTDNLKGFQVQVAQDPDFTQILDTFDTTCVGCAPYPDVFQFVYTPQKNLPGQNVILAVYSLSTTEFYPDGGVSRSRHPVSHTHSRNPV